MSCWAHIFWLVLLVVVCYGRLQRQRPLQRPLQRILQSTDCSTITGSWILDLAEAQGTPIEFPDHIISALDPLTRLDDRQVTLDIVLASNTATICNGPYTGRLRIDRDYAFQLTRKSDDQISFTKFRVDSTSSSAGSVYAQFERKLLRVFRRIQKVEIIQSEVLTLLDKRERSILDFINRDLPGPAIKDFLMRMGDIDEKDDQGPLFPGGTYLDQGLPIIDVNDGQSPITASRNASWVVE